MTNRNLIVSCVLLLALLAGAGTLAAQRPGPGPMMSPEPPKDPEYVKLLDKAKGGDTAIDFKAFRMAYARSGFPGARSVDPKIRLKLIEDGLAAGSGGGAGNFRQIPQSGPA